MQKRALCGQQCGLPVFLEEPVADQTLKQEHIGTPRVARQTLCIFAGSCGRVGV